MYIVNVANELYTELAEPADISIPAIAFWLRSNIGRLAAYANTTYSIDSNYEVTPDLSEVEKEILKAMYVIYYYDRLTRAALAEASTGGFLEISSDGSTVKKVNKNEIIKSYNVVRVAAKEDLMSLINNYKYNKAGLAYNGFNVSPNGSLPTTSIYNYNYVCTWKNYVC